MSKKIRIKDIIKEITDREININNEVFDWTYKGYSKNEISGREATGGYIFVAVFDEDMGESIKFSGTVKEFAKFLNKNGDKICNDKMADIYIENWSSSNNKKIITNFNKYINLKYQNVDIGKGKGYFNKQKIQ